MYVYTKVHTTVHSILQFEAVIRRITQSSSNKSIFIIKHNFFNIGQQRSTTSIGYATCVSRILYVSKATMSPSVVVQWNVDIRHVAVLLKHSSQFILPTTTPNCKCNNWLQRHSGGCIEHMPNGWQSTRPQVHSPATTRYNSLALGLVLGRGLELGRVLDRHKQVDVRTYIQSKKCWRTGSLCRTIALFH